MRIKKRGLFARLLVFLLSLAVLPLVAAGSCGGKTNGGAGTPPAVPKVTWPAAPKEDKNGPQVPLDILPPPEPGNDCVTGENPMPDGLTISFGSITGLIYSACTFPEAPQAYTVKLTIVVKLANGRWHEVKSQEYDEIPVWLPEKSPYTITADCIPGVYALRVFVHGLGSNGKYFEAGPTQWDDFYVHEEDCP